MMIYLKVSLISLLLIFGSVFNTFGQNRDVMNYPNSLKYANYLFNSKQYQYSAIEYERITFLAPTDTLAKLRLIQSYRLSGDFKNAKTKLDKFYYNCQFNYPEIFAIENIQLLFLNKQYQEAYEFIKKNKTIGYPKKIEYELGTLLKQYKWTDAQRLVTDYLSLNNGTSKLYKLNTIAINGSGLRYKNPISAALLSAIIPGSGKIYTKQWADGIYAFAFVSAFSWLTYNSIKNKGMNTNSIIYGSIALSFYAANIYGSHKSALRYNQQLNRHTTKDVEHLLFEY